MITRTVCVVTGGRVERTDCSDFIETVYSENFQFGPARRPVLLVVGPLAGKEFLVQGSGTVGAGFLRNEAEDREAPGNQKEEVRKGKLHWVSERYEKSNDEYRRAFRRS